MYTAASEYQTDGVVVKSIGRRNVDDGELLGIKQSTLVFFGPTRSQSFFFFFSSSVWFEVSNPILLTDSSRQVEMEKREVGKWINHPRCAHSLSLFLVSIGAARISENVGGRKEGKKRRNGELI